MIFDPFGDFETRGYLRNVFAEKDPAIIKRLEHQAFRQRIGGTGCARPVAIPALPGRA